MTIDNYTLIQLFKTSPDEAVSELIKHDRSVRTREVALQILNRMVKDFEKDSEKEENKGLDEFALLEQAYAEYEAYDQLTLFFIQVYSRLGLSMDGSKRLDAETKDVCGTAAYTILQCFTELVSHGVNPSRFLRGIISAMQYCCNPATGQSDTFQQVFLDLDKNLMLAVQQECKRLGKGAEYVSVVERAYEQADLFKDLSLITF